MHAVRVPLLGMAVAVALLLVENAGALAYREHAMASIESEITDARAVGHRAAQRREIERTVRASKEACARDSSSRACTGCFHGSYHGNYMLPYADLQPDQR